MCNDFVPCFNKMLASELIVRLKKFIPMHALILKIFKNYNEQISYRKLQKTFWPFLGDWRASLQT